MIYTLLLFLLSACLVCYIQLNKVFIKTASMAVVMALGIIIQGVLLNFYGTSIYYSSFGILLCIVVLSLWITFTTSLFLSYLKGIFIEKHYSNQINRFGIGTWIAGTSICGILFYKQFIQWGIISQVITYMNIILRMIYIGISIRTLIEITKIKLI